MGFDVVALVFVLEFLAFDSLCSGSCFQGDDAGRRVIDPVPELEAKQVALFKYPAEPRRESERARPCPRASTDTQ